MAKVLFAIVFIVMLIGGLFSWFYQPLMGVVAVSDLGEKLKVGFIYLGPLAITVGLISMIKGA
jgi:hypothetical protein